jgi:hypothetical protein
VCCGTALPYLNLFSFISRVWKKIMVLISSSALRTYTTHAIDYKAVPQDVSFPDEKFVRHKLLRKQT